MSNNIQTMGYQELVDYRHEIEAWEADRVRYCAICNRAAPDTAGFAKLSREIDSRLHELARKDTLDFI